MGHNEYPKILTAAYDLAINWKVYTKGSSVASKDDVAFTTESEEADVHATDGMNMAQSGDPVICHVCGKNQYANRFPDREDSTSEKKAEKFEDTPEKESAPEKSSVNVTTGSESF